MHLFETVKQSVTTRQAAERYGLNVNRNGMAVCPFHRDRHPSMKVDRRYYCFGCGATGDVIDFVSRLHGISAKEAALMLARRGRNGRAPPVRREEAAAGSRGTEIQAHGAALLSGACRLLSPAAPMEGGTRSQPAR